MDQEAFIDSELAEVRRTCTTMDFLEIISCVPAMVRVKIQRSRVKILDICLQFPSDYPHSLILLELKSKTLPQKFLDIVSRSVDVDQAKFIERSQILPIIDHVLHYVDSNPLCFCVEEVSNLKKLLNNSDGSFLKVKQKQSCVHLRTVVENYYFECKYFIGEDYPDQAVKVELCTSNFPKFFQAFIIAQCTELARRCVQPPLMITRTKLNAAPAPLFECKPSLFTACKFTIEESQRIPFEPCALCGKRAFCEKPSDQQDTAETKDVIEIEWVYCSHLFHHSCLDTYMKTPPFKGGKKCPTCQQVIYHRKWSASADIAEQRWANKQAKQRELDEIADFMS